MHRRLIVRLMRKISPVCQFDIGYSKGDLVADNLGVVVQSANSILERRCLERFWSTPKVLVLVISIHVHSDIALLLGVDFKIKALNTCSF